MMNITLPTRREIKRLTRPFLILFAISFLAINWSQVYWVFSYRAVSGVMGEFFQGIEKKITDPVNAFFAIEDEAGKTAVPSGKNNLIEIPSLGISAPVFFDKEISQREIKKALNGGAVAYPDSVFPGEKGQTVILGHSAPPNWPKIKYDWIFSDLSKLKDGDEIFIFFNNKQYVYHATRKVFLNRGEDLPGPSVSAENTLFLVSCWPPGKDFKRIAIEAVL